MVLGLLSKRQLALALTVFEPSRPSLCNFVVNKATLDGFFSEHFFLPKEVPSHQYTILRLLAFITNTLYSLQLAGSLTLNL